MTLTWHVDRTDYRGWGAEADAWLPASGWCGGPASGWCGGPVQGGATPSCLVLHRADTSYPCGVQCDPLSRRLGAWFHQWHNIHLILTDNASLPFTVPRLVDAPSSKQGLSSDVRHLLTTLKSWFFGAWFTQEIYFELKQSKTETRQYTLSNTPWKWGVAAKKRR